MGADARDEPEGDHAEHAAERLVRLPRGVDLGDHFLARRRVETADRRLVDGVEVLRPEPVPLRRLDAPDARDVRADLHAERPEERLGQRAGGRSRGGLARRRALEHVAHVAEAELLDAREVGVPGPRQVDLLDLCLHRPGVHPLLPVLVVAVDDPERDGTPEGAPMANAGGDLGAVLLDLHAPAAAVAELPAREVTVDVLGPELEARRQALDDRGEARAVGFAGGYEAERHGVHTLRTGLHLGDGQGRMRGDRVEVGVPVEHRRARPDRHGGDQAVGQPADRRALTPTGPVDRGGRLVVGGLLEREELTPIEQTAQLSGLMLVARAGKDLEDHEPGCSERLIGLDRSGQPAIDGTTGGALELDPGRTVDQDHDRCRK